MPFDLPDDRLAGRVAVITGASRGLGAGLAARFVEHGIAVGLCARSVPALPDEATGIAAAVDVAHAAAVDDFADRVAAELGPIDLWVNNAGVLEPIGPARDVDPDEAARALAVNVGGVLHGTAAFCRHRRTVGSGGVLVNITSGAARSVYQGWSIYGASKAAVDHLTEIVAAEEPDVRCHAVAPGVVDTDMQALIRAQDRTDFPAIDRFVDLHRTGSWNSPRWVADHLLGLLADTFRPDGVVVRVADEPRDAS
ncbi:MAG: SDR family NAD(P)-dependent oxidoreductase [Thermomicrobiales bacterium]|nr:SDR family NAD(P)-dependent oxidoreductase [Thermomicrobiales bacterium]